MGVLGMLYLYKFSYENRNEEGLKEMKQRLNEAMIVMKQQKKEEYKFYEKEIDLIKKINYVLTGKVDHDQKWNNSFLDQIEFKMTFKETIQLIQEMDIETLKNTNVSTFLTKIVERVKGVNMNEIYKKRLNEIMDSEIWDIIK